MATRAQPPVRTFVDGERFDTQDAIDKFNENNQMIQVKFGALEYDDLDTSSQTTIVFDGTLDLRGHLVSNVSNAVSVINVNKDTRSFKAIMDAETNPVIFIPANTVVNLTTKVTIKDNTQIIGAGPSSVIRMSSTSGGRTPPAAAQAGFVMLEVPATTQNWSIRNLTLEGRRGHGLSSGTGLRIFNSRSSGGEIEDVAFGPPLDYTAAQLRSAFHTSVDIAGSSGLRFTNVYIRGTSNPGIKMVSSNYATSKVEDVELVDCSIQQNSKTGVYVKGASNLIFRDNEIGESGTDNMRILLGQFCHVVGNDLYNASTASAGTDMNLTINGTANTNVVGPLMMDNRFIDRTDPSITASTKNHVSLGAHVTSIILMNNVFSEPQAGRLKVVNNSTYKVSVAGEALTGESPISQQGNIMHIGGYGFKSHAETFAAGHESTRWQTWKNFGTYVDADPRVIAADKGPYGEVERIRNYKRDYAGECAHPKDDFLAVGPSQFFRIDQELECPQPVDPCDALDDICVKHYDAGGRFLGEECREPIPGQDCAQISPTICPPVAPVFAEANIGGGWVQPETNPEDLIFTNTVIERFGNRGTLLTPEILYSQTTHIDDEVRAVIANWNLAPETVAPDGVATFTPMAPSASNTTTALFPGVASATAAVTGMNNNPLSAHISSTNTDQMSIISPGYRVASFKTGETVVVGKPTWVSVKV